MTDHQVSEAFSLVADLAHALGAAPLNQFPNCWEHQVDGLWWVSINAHPTPKPNSKGGEVPPYSCAIEYNGWPAGIINPRGGVLAAGEAANEDTFIAALRGALS